jgi:hypothetical protein
MSQSVESVLQGVTFYTDEINYKLVKLHPKAITLAASIVAEVAEPFLTLIVDKDEVSLVMPSHLIEEFTERLRDYNVSETDYRLITLDMELEPTLVGLMAVLASTLANAGVSILPLAAFSRDHLLVPHSQLETALSALKALKK